MAGADKELEGTPAGTLFKYNLDDRVALAMSKEKGMVIGRAQYQHCNNQYLVRYVTTDGRQVEGWFDYNALIGPMLEGEKVTSIKKSSKR